MEKKQTIQVIYKCFVGNLSDEVQINEYMTKEKERVEKSLNFNNEDRFHYNVTALPTKDMYSTVETLPYLYDRD